MLKVILSKEFRRFEMADALIEEDPFGPEKPYYGFKNLQPGNYEILSFRFVHNQYHDASNERSPRRIVLIELEEQVLFLPPYMALKLRDDDDILEGYNNDGIKRYLCFGGRRTEEG